MVGDYIFLHFWRNNIDLVDNFDFKFMYYYYYVLDYCDEYFTPIILKCL